jgi:hypothetical protein
MKKKAFLWMGGNGEFFHGSLDSENNFYDSFTLGQGKFALILQHVEEVFFSFFIL